MHDLWREFAVAETMAKDYRDRHWVYETNARSAVGRSGRWRENVQRMGFMSEGWRGLRDLKLDGFMNVEALKLEVNGWMEDYELELDLRGLKNLKSLDVISPHELTIKLKGLSSVSDLGYLHLWSRGFSPCIDEIGRLTNLQVLKLDGCDGVQVLDVTELTVLLVVWIARLPNLVTVRGLSSRLVGLRLLCMLWCTSLRECAGVGELYALEVISLFGCEKLEELPCLGRLSSLRKLNIGGCKSLRVVQGVRELVALEEFRAKGCLKLGTLPDMVKLSKLRILQIRKCPVQEVRGLDGLISLTRLYASVGKLSGEQPDLSQLSALVALKIHEWNGPICTSIRILVMLEDLQLFDCHGEDVVVDLQNLKRLKVVVFERCEYKDVSGLSNSTALERLCLGDCEKLERLPEFERLTKLNDLRLTGCDNVKDWPSESTLCSLNTLEVDGSSLTRLGRELERLPGLRKVKLSDSGCEHVLSMTSLMSRLEVLHIIVFLKLEALDVSIFRQLKELRVRGCSGLMRVTCTTPLAALTELEVSDCETLVEMPDLSMFQQLANLHLKNCRALKRLTCSRPATSMKRIELTRCDSRVEMPDRSRFPNLQIFFRTDCFPIEGDSGGEGDGDVDDLEVVEGSAEDFNSMSK